jgi:hypothetical protein
MTSGGLRPLRVGEILDAAIKLYVRNARVLIGAAAAVVVPVQLLTAVVLLSTYDSGQDIPAGVGSTAPQPDAAARAGATLITTLASLIAATLVTAACVKAVSDSYLDQGTSVGASLRFAARRLLPLIALTFLQGIGIAIGFVLLVIPGVWLYASWWVAIPALLIERRNPVRALGRSRRLVKGRWWPVAGVALITNVMVLFVGGIVTGLLTGLALSGGPPSVLFAVLISTAATVVSQTLLQPFTASVTTVTYFDLRIRREGFELELMADQLGLPEASLPKPPPLAPGAFGPADVGTPGGPPYWPPPPGWQPGQ